MMNRIKKALKRNRKQTPTLQEYAVGLEPDKIQYVVTFDEKTGEGKLQIVGDKKVGIEVLIVSLGSLRDMLLRREGAILFQRGSIEKENETAENQNVES